MIKFGMFLDKTSVKSNYIKEGKSFNYFNSEPYSRMHSISNECQLGFWSYPTLFEGKLINLSEFDKLPDEEFDLIFLNLESENVRFKTEEIKNKYKCKIFGIFKETWDVYQQTQYESFSKCDKIITGIYHHVNLLTRIYGNKVHYLPQPVNIEYLRNNFYIKNKEDTLFCYLTTNQRSIYNIEFCKHLHSRYNLDLKWNDPKKSIDWADFLRYFGKFKYHVNLDTEVLSAGQQTCQCAVLGVINLGGNNDATYNLYPETYGLDFKKCENFLKYCLNSDQNRSEYEQIVLQRLSDIYSYGVIKNNIINLL